MKFNAKGEIYVIISEKNFSCSSVLMEHFVTFNRGILYNLSFKQKNWIKTLTLQTETAIALLPTQEKDYIKFQLVHNIKPLYKQYDSTKQYITNHAKNE